MGATRVSFVVVAVTCHGYFGALTGNLCVIKG